LVIGYGNPLRGDDAAGPLLAGRVAAWELPGVTAVAVHQLTPELAAQLAECDRAVFLDARQGGGEIGLRQLAPAETHAGLEHASDPARLLALTRDLFGSSPEAWLLTLPGVEFGFGTGLSAPTARALEEAAGLLGGVLGAEGAAQSFAADRNGQTPQV
jgi:hydrogenase maturation protease